MLIFVLSIIIYNGYIKIQDHSKKSLKQYHDINHHIKECYVDLYATTLSTIPKNADPGMTCLIDRGWKNLETGIYLIRENNVPLKITSPDINHRYHIVRGEFAGHVHTMQQLNLEIREHVQEYTEHDYKINNTVKIQLLTNILIIHPINHLDSDKLHLIMEFEKKDKTQISRIEVANLSSLPLLYHDFTIPAGFIGIIYISYNTSNSSYILYHS